MEARLKRVCHSVVPFTDNSRTCKQAVMMASRSMAAWGRQGRQELQSSAGQLGGDGNVLYLDCGDGFLGLYICLYSPNYLLQIRKQTQKIPVGQRTG